MIGIATKPRQAFSPFQVQMLELVSHVQSQQEMDDIRQLLAQYFAKRAEDEIDRLWDNGTLSNQVIEEWKNEHMRTPYRQ